jgi:SagB-type dehydrogenase family enzyme
LGKVRNTDSKDGVSSPGAHDGDRGAWCFDLFSKPRFLRELVVIPFTAGIAIDGTTRLQIFQGEATRHFLPTLIPLLDGSRTIEQLLNAVPGVAQRYIQNAILVMARSGFLEDERVPAKYHDRLFTNGETAPFFRRILATESANGSQEVCDNLGQAQVAIVQFGNSQQSADELRTLLLRTGMTGIQCLLSKDLDELGRQIAQTRSTPLIVSLSSRSEDSAWLSTLDRWCEKRGISWLRSSIDPTGLYADIGPYFVASNPCYRCFSSIHRTAPSAPGPEAPLRRTDSCFWLGLLATEIVFLTSRAGYITTGAEFRRCSLPTWTSRSFRFARIPGCSRCRALPKAGIEDAADHLSLESIETATVYEDYVGIQSLGIQSLSSSLQVALSGHSFRSLAFPRNRMLYCNQVKLSHDIPRLERSVFDLRPEKATSYGEQLRLDELGVLLLMTGGLRGTPSPNALPRRWAATAGNLGSVELFVVAHRVHGLSSGIYRYDPEQHSLAHFQRHHGTLSSGELLRRAIPNETEFVPDALVVLAGAYGRVAEKYHEFAYRLLNLDAGVALSQLRMVAATLNLFSHTPTRWAEDLIADQLGLDKIAEHCTAAIPLWKGSAEDFREQPLTEFASRPFHEQVSHTTSCQVFNGKSVSQVVEMLYQESRLQESELQVSPFAVPSTLITRNPADGPETVLPPPPQGGRLVAEILSCRKSVRRYLSQDVSQEQLGGMLDYAYKHDRDQWPSEYAAGLPLTFYVLPFRVQTLDSGVYVYEPQKHAVRRQRPFPMSRQVPWLFVQSEFSHAPVVIWIAGNLAGALARHGAFGHRQLLMRAGAAANHLWVAGMATGLSGCIVAGVVPGEAREWLGLDGYRNASLVAFVAGTPNSL